MMRRHDGENGHVMIFTIVLMVMLCLGVLVFYDLQHAIAGKVKFQAAADSAALTGAMWQKEALNTIGELNLVKVTNTLLELDPDPVAANQLVARTQTRISFAYPLMGLSAAQQAARLNGAAINPAVRQVMQYHLMRLNSAIYDQTEQCINGYDWRQDYEEMLSEIIAQGPAVRMNSRMSAATNIHPSWLGYERFYWAILSGNFCNGIIRSMFQNGSVPEDFWHHNWWQDIGMNRMSFAGESEYLTLGIQFVSVEDNVAAAGELRTMVRRYGWNYDDSFSSGSFCCYDGSWYYTPNKEWRDGRLLRGRVRDSAWHGGAIAGAQVEDVITRTMNFRMNRDIKKYERGEVNAKAASSSYRPKAIAAAKTFGELSSAEAPCAVPIILPVFRNVALVPSSMYPNNNLSNNQSIYFELFLLWLADHGRGINDLWADSVADSLPAPAANYIDYLRALQAVSSNELNYRITTEIDGKTVTVPATLRDYIRYWFEDHECYDPPGRTSAGPSL
ncbi:MAG: Tad domain-containing protein [Victivallales bacterium]|nr:Tad domain-containing protein [Victivallales bacterium]